jgi:hypothetical protein
MHTFNITGLPDGRYVYQLGDKVPLGKSGKKAAVNRKNTWLTKDEAIKRLDSNDNDNSKGTIGYMLGNGVCAIDIDHADIWMQKCIRSWVKKFRSYSEISMSGEGYHILFINTQININKKYTSAGIEIYSSNRYIALTGNIYCDNHRVIEVDNNHLDAFLAWACDVNLAYRVMAKNPKFEALWNEPGQVGNSENDLAFCSMLARWGADDEQIKRLIRMSNRNRDKLDREDYLNLTLAKVREGQNDNVVGGCATDTKRVRWHPEYVRVMIDDKWLTLAEFYAKQDEFIYGEDDIPSTELEIEPTQFDKFVVEPVRHNVQRLLEHYGYKVRFNEMKLSYEAIKVKGDKEDSVSFEDTLVEILDGATHQGLKIGRDRLQDSLCHLARSKSYNPIKVYLDKCWLEYRDSDKEEYIKLISTIKVDEDMAEEEKAMYITKFLLQMVAIVLDDSAAAQYILVLQGDGGIGKTTWFRNLIPEEFRSQYFLEGRNFDLSNKDHILETISTWLTEMGEISSTFRKSDQEAIKNFISSTRDKLRPPYARESIVKKRRTSFCGTTNDVEFLTDLTGTRRFLVIPCTTIDYRTVINMDKVWGYIYHLIKVGEPYWLNKNQIDMVVARNRNTLLKPPEILMIEELFILHPKPNEGVWIPAKVIEEKTGLSKFAIGRRLKQYKVIFKMMDGYTQYYIKPLNN